MFSSRSLINLRLTIHSKKRLKERAGIDTKKKRIEFLKEFSRNGLRFSEIPKESKFIAFKNYMKKYIKKSKFKDPFCTVYLFRRFFIIVSLTGFIITILNIICYYSQPLHPYAHSSPPCGSSPAPYGAKNAYRGGVTASQYRFIICNICLRVNTTHPLQIMNRL